MKVIQLAAKYREIQSDPKLTTLGPLFTLYTGRLMQLLDRLEENDTPDRMKAIADAWQEFKVNFPGLQSFLKGDKEALKAYNKINFFLEAAFHDYAAWNEIINLGDEIRKLSESRMKILKDMKALMSADEVFEMAAMLLAAVANVVDDPDKLERISTEFANILGEDYTGGPEQGSGEIIEIRSGYVDRGQILHTGDDGRSNATGEDLS